MQRILILLFLVCGITVSGQGSLKEILSKYNSGEIPYISVEDLQAQKNNIVILDAREPGEYQVSHLKNATLVGYSKFDITSLDTLSKKCNIVVYCSLGVRSEKISKKLSNAGFKNVRNLYGGIFSWKNSGYPVYDMDDKPTEKVHAFSPQWAVWLNNAEKIY
ncbi:rhodanese-like domain-containing protein [Christiangramia aquimixticola]|uniref:rhodanese-like domain-containing protein n=1 Tax=Christiangramia aquimixticola TaxID=1697558 RepID=UPI003AA7EB55